MFCTKCGTSLEDDVHFCPVCGTAQTIGETVNPKPIMPQTEPAMPKKPTKKKLIFISVIAIVLILVGIFAYSKASGSDIVGTWLITSDDSNVYMVFNRDHSGEMKSGAWSVKYEWRYNATNHKIAIDTDILTNPFNMSYDPHSDTISQNGVTLIRVS